MSQYRESVEDILSRAKPQKEEPKESNLNTHITIQKCNFGNSTFLVCFIFALAILVIGIIYCVNSKNSQTQYISSVSLTAENMDMPISENQVLEIKELVKSVATCERKHFNAIHNELKQQLKYASYKKINTQMYDKIKEILTPRTNCLLLY